MQEKENLTPEKENVYDESQIQVLEGLEEPPAAVYLTSPDYLGNTADISGISAIYKGGACTYSNDIKEKILGVSSETLREFGAVSEQTASEMACGIRRAFDSDIGIGITGIAGPSSDNTLKPVGLIYVAISFGSKTIVKELRNCFSESIRTNNRLSAVETALKLLGDI